MTDALKLASLEDAVGYWLRRAQLAVFEDFARRFAALNLTPAQFSTLVAIRENPDARLSDLAEALGIRRPNFVAMVDELERRGLAERATAAVDRRAKTVRLTDAGAASLAHGLAAQAEQNADIRARIGEAEREGLLKVLRQLAKT
jgi:DNA-binding MarR family transcriptional regulator